MVNCGFVYIVCDYFEGLVNVYYEVFFDWCDVDLVVVVV